MRGPEEEAGRDRDALRGIRPDPDPRARPRSASSSTSSSGTTRAPSSCRPSSPTPRGSSGPSSTRSRSSTGGRDQGDREVLEPRLPRPHLLDGLPRRLHLPLPLLPQRRARPAAGDDPEPGRRLLPVLSRRPQGLARGRLLHGRGAPAPRGPRGRSSASSGSGAFSSSSTRTARSRTASKALLAARPPRLGGHGRQGPARALPRGDPLERRPREDRPERRPPPGLRRATHLPDDGRPGLRRQGRRRQDRRMAQRRGAATSSSSSCPRRRSIPPTSRSSPSAGPSSRRSWPRPGRISARSGIEGPE